MALRRPLLVLLPLQAAASFYRLDLLPVWGDEQFTLDVIASPWSEIPATLARDIHPPLYYVLLKLWAAATGFLSPIVSARAFSVVCALATTVAVDRLFLPRRDDPRVRTACLLLLSLAPALLLYGRMARSYSLQALLACLAIAAGARLLDRATGSRTLVFSAAAAALLWTHYLPGIAVAAAIGLPLLVRSWKHAVGAAAATAALYSPWLAVLGDAVGKAAARDVYRLSGSPWSEQALRAAYTALSFGGGEAHVAWTLVLAAVACLALGAFAFLGLARDASPLPSVVLLAAAVAWVGASSWVSYAFMPGRLLFLLPFVIYFAARGMPGVWPAFGLLLLYGVFDTQYFAGRLLNKGYLIPYRAIAEEIREDSGAALVVADAFNADPSPLRPLLPERSRLIRAEGDGFEAEVRRAAASKPPTIWYLRTARDITPGKRQEALEADLALGRERDVLRYLPYSDLDRFVLGRLTGQEPPTHHYVAVRLAAPRRSATIEKEEQ